jgi:lipoprotein signal peptidase
MAAQDAPFLPRRRRIFVGAVAVLVVADLLLKAYVEATADRGGCSGPLLIHVQASPGVAFGLGDTVSG